MKYFIRHNISKNKKYITIRILLTGRPDISEYFFAGLKLGGALIALSGIYN